MPSEPALPVVYATMSQLAAAAVAEGVTRPICRVQQWVNWYGVDAAFRHLHNSVLRWGRNSKPWRCASSDVLEWLSRPSSLSLFAQASTFKCALRWSGYHLMRAVTDDTSPWSQGSLEGRRILSGVSTDIAVLTFMKAIEFSSIYDRIVSPYSGWSGAFLTQPNGQPMLRWERAVRVMRAENPRFGLTLGKAVMAGATYLPLFEHFRDDRRWGVGHAALASGLAGVAASLPVDYISMRTQKASWRWMGVHASMQALRVVPHFVVWMTLIDLFKPLAPAEHARRNSSGADQTRR